LKDLDPGVGSQLGVDLVLQLGQEPALVFEKEPPVPDEQRHFQDQCPPLRLTWKQTGRATGGDPASPRPATLAPPEVESCSVPTSPHRQEGRMKHVSACLTVVALAGALPGWAEDELAPRCSSG